MDMIRTNGQYFQAALDALKLPTDERGDAENNAKSIVGKIVATYREHISSDHVGNLSSAIPDGFSHDAHPQKLTGLVYGRIQSGKTRAMIASAALAFDNGFRIVVVLTSNINDLVIQTHADFAAGLPDVMVYTKDDQLVGEIDNAKLDLVAGDGRMLIVCSKGAGSLQNVNKFLRQVDANKYPSIIFDDEGDQASLDTNTRRRSQSDVAVAPSSINQLIQEGLRRVLSCHIYVSVTGTPQAVLLQSANSNNRPSFIELLPPGKSYIGGDYFFGTDEPEENKNRLVRIVDFSEKNRLLNPRVPIPEGLRRAIIFFLLSSAAVIKNEELPRHGKGYSFLCHPSLKNAEQEMAEQRIAIFLGMVKASLLKVQDSDRQILDEMAKEYENLKTTLGDKTPPIEDLFKIIVAYLRNRRILVVNAQTKRQGIAYGPGLNFLIGGNTLGRGIAIRDLLVTYYLRDSKISQIDTMHQHARMFGYRQKILQYTRLFMPRHLYYRFRDIHHSDQNLRQFIEKYKDSPETFPIEFTSILRATRPGVLDVNTTDTLEPGKQIYPNRIIIPQKSGSYSKIKTELLSRFGSDILMEANGKIGTTITVDKAVELVKLIKTKSDNTWRDKTIDAVIHRVASEFNNEVALKFRHAKRTLREEGFMSTGTLSGAEYDSAKAAHTPTLWIMEVEIESGDVSGKGYKFMYPTFVIPDSLPRLLMFNKG